MMYFLHNIYVCLIITLVHISECNGNKRKGARSPRVTYSPRRFRSFETSVKLTIRFARNQKISAGQIIKFKVFNRRKLVTTFNKTVRSFDNVQLEISCEVFATPGRYFIEYVVQGLSKTFVLLTHSPIIVRSEKIHIDVKNNHTAFDGRVSAWLNSKQGRCKAFKGRLKLYWIKPNSKEHVLVTTREVDQEKIENRTRVNFPCNVFDTEGKYYLVYFSNYNNKTIARSHNMSVSWGKYEIIPQSKHIFPCSNSFAIKFSSPYCDRTEDEIEMRSRAYNNFIDSKTAYHGFRSVFFPCAAFKKHIGEYCFHYITKSSLSKKRKIQATLCLPTTKKEPGWSDWTEWSAWGTCSSRTECGEGRKYRLRFCPPANLFQNSKSTSQCTGKHIESMPCTLPPCKEKKCESCGCVLSAPVGTILSPKFLLPFPTYGLSSCHWVIEIAEGTTVKLWFDSLRLAKNSSVVIKDGNSSSSEVLREITYGNQKEVGEIYSTSHVVSIWYSNKGEFNRTSFLISYASVDKMETHVKSTSSKSTSSKRIAKMTFIGVLAILVVITFTIVAVIIVRIRRQRSLENAPKTSLTQRPPSSRTSTACMSESTMRSSYEPQLSGDESVNNSSTLSRVNNNNRARLSTRMERTPVHVCPKCCPSVDLYSCECNIGCHRDCRRMLYSDAYYRPNMETSLNSLGRVQRVHSIIERRLSGASFESDEDFLHRTHQQYL